MNETRRRKNSRNKSRRSPDPRILTSEKARRGKGDGGLNTLELDGVRGSPVFIPLLFVGLFAVVWRKEAAWVCDWKEGLRVCGDRVHRPEVGSGASKGGPWPGTGGWSASRRQWDSGRNPDSSARPGISIGQRTAQDSSGWETGGGGQSKEQWQVRPSS